MSQVGPLLCSYWHQYDHFNDQMAPCAKCGGKYPAGCLVIAASQVFRNYQQNFTMQVNNVSTLNQWSSIMTNPNGTAANGADYYYDATVKASLTGLIKAFYVGCNTTLDCGGASTTNQAAINYLTKYFTLNNTNHTVGINMSDIKTSLDQLKLVLAAVCMKAYVNINLKAGYAWVVDGYTVTKLNPGWDQVIMVTT